MTVNHGTTETSNHSHHSSNGVLGVSYTNMAPPVTNGVNGIGKAKSEFTPMAICGMACHLPGGIQSPQQLWDFLLSKKDARAKVPESRYNVDAFYSSTDRQASVNTQFGYFLDDDLRKFDGSLFNMSAMELERCDPQQRQMLEVARECIDDAGEKNWRGSNTGVFIGNFGEDWADMFEKDNQQYGTYRLLGSGDFALSNRVSYEMNLQGPSMTIRTACSAALVALNEACLSIARGDCRSAIVGGASLILTPSMTIKLAEQGALSRDGSCKSFSADANGYVRAEAISAIYIKPLADAIRDGNPVRAVIRGTSTNSDGKTPGITYPGIETQEALMRQAYKVAGISDFGETAFIELHGTGTPVGDPVEAQAVARVFGKDGIYIGSVKPNLGHSEAASGLTSLIKGVLALENRIIPPNIKFNEPNPKIPFESAKLVVPVEPTPWPTSRKERVSINSFGIGGTNAHVILDSAASFNARPEIEESSDRPQLLVYSASSENSLKRMMELYHDYLARYPERIEDVAFTLANRREHLSHRAFVVASREKPGVASPSSKPPANVPDVIMVFTGQGAQWPQMGRDLIRANPVFKDTIKKLDQVLKSLGEASPKWTIEAELRKPARTSQLGTAELSQPLCTAIQIGLVNALVAVGIKPAAVVGHSSGEIAGAYASGALTAAEAIIAAFHRGTIAKKQTRPGAMAAIGLSWQEVKPFLGPGVGVACENSPKSVTLSGDADKVDAIVKQIQESRPDVLARLLKVEKAYHSYHMAEIGADYRSVIEPSLTSPAVPTLPFFSSVKGRLLAEGEKVDAQYWQENLESPVLFNSAVSAIAKHPIGKNAVFLEVGPHSALAGPLRQILTEHSNTAPYVASMLRGQDCVEALLSAIGKLYALHYPVNFQALFPRGVCLSDLPPYPWNRSQTYWHETRVTKEWRERKYAHHALLGVKSTESTDSEPVWRNLFHLDSAAWVRDHIVSGDIVFPFAAYIAMAGEAVRQASGIQEGFRLRNIVATTALVIHEGKPVELITSFRPLGHAKQSEHQWWEFSISSHNGNTWTKHCTGEACALTQGTLAFEDIPSLPRKVAARKWYDTVRLGGLAFGPTFQCLENIKSSVTYPGLATATVKNSEKTDAEYHLHPTVVDNSLQILVVASSLGLGRNYRTNIATSIADLSVLRSTADLVGSGKATYLENSSVTGTSQYVADGKVVLRASGVGLTYLDDIKPKDPHAAARHVWAPHIDFLGPRDLVQPTVDHSAYTPVLDKILQLCLHRSKLVVTDIQPSAPHLQKYKEWILSQTVSEVKDQTDDEIDALVHQLSETPAASAALALFKISTAMTDLLSGRQHPLDLLGEDDLLSKVERFINELDITKLLRIASHTKPNLRILELGAGVGSFTTGNLSALGNHYSKYTFSDVNSSLFGAAKENFKGIPNMEFVSLDIGEDPEAQGFSDRVFDLIIARNVIHKTKSLSASLKNARKLLHPEGRLLLQELSPTSKWINYVLGVLDSWWTGAADGRDAELYVGLEQWQTKLHQAGFEAAEIISDAEEPYQLNIISLARPQKHDAASKSVTLLTPESDSNVQSITESLQKRGYEVSYCTIHDVPPANQDIIVLLDENAPFFAGLTAEAFEHFNSFINKLNASGLFWITRPCHSNVQDPRYGQVLGVSRVLRSELDLDFAICETDQAFNNDKVLDVFEHFHQRKQANEFKPEMEYEVQGDQVNVGRFFHFTLGDELLTSEPNDKIVLTAKRPFRPSDLFWEKQRSDDEPTGDEVQVEVYAAGINNKAKSANAFVDHDASGIVRQVGPEVHNLQVGDRVMIATKDAVASIVTISEKYCVAIPASLSLIDAATLPTPYATALHALVDIGSLQKGQSVLIQDANSDIGLAMLQVAQWLGADIYATVGDEEKAQSLRHLFSSLSSKVFLASETLVEESIRQGTNGRGVDLLILDSLSEEISENTWNSVAESGKVLELSDITRPRSLNSSHLLNRSFSGVSIDRLRASKPNDIHRLLELTVKLLEESHLKVIQPAAVFVGSEASNAFKLAFEGTEIGKTVIELRHSSDGTDLVSSLAMERLRTPIFDSSASYLLVGGLGGLGRSVSTWAVEHGARHLIYLSRSAGKSQADQDLIKELESMGATVQLVAGSVTNIEDVARAINGAAAPLKGIMQMSIVLRDQAWQKMTWADWSEAVSPKVEGTWNLHNATVEAGISLDFFILFSAISGIIGQPGQANYAGANTFLDAFRQYRKDLGLPASSIQIGPVEDVGVIARDGGLLQSLKSSGFYTLKETDILDALALAIGQPSPKALASTKDLGSSDPQTFVLGLASTSNLSSANNRLVWRKDPRMAAYHNGSNTESNAGSGNEGLKTFLKDARANPAVLQTPEAVTILASEIGHKVLGLLMKTDEELDLSLGIADLGMDSLLAIEMRAWWKQTFRTEISTLEMLGSGTLEMLGKLAAEGLYKQLSE